MAELAFTKEDEFNPIYCTHCHRHIPRSAADKEGSCPDCSRALQPGDGGHDAAHVALQDAGLLTAGGAGSIANRGTALAMVWIVVIVFVILCAFSRHTLFGFTSQSTHSSWYLAKSCRTLLGYAMIVCGLLGSAMIAHRRIAPWFVWLMWWLLWLVGIWRITTVVNAYESTGASLFVGVRGGSIVGQALLGLVLGVIVGCKLPQIADEFAARGSGGFLRRS